MWRRWKQTVDSQNQFTEVSRHARSKEKEWQSLFYRGTRYSFSQNVRHRNSQQAQVAPPLVKGFAGASYSCNSTVRPTTVPIRPVELFLHMSGGRPGLPIPASWRQWPLTPLRGAITSRFTTSHKFSSVRRTLISPSLSATLLMELPLFSLSLECVTYCILSLYSPSPPVGSFAEGERRVFLDCGILRGAACSLVSSFSAPSSAPASSFLLFPRSTFGCCVARMWGGERERGAEGKAGLASRAAAVPAS